MSADNKLEPMEFADLEPVLVPVKIGGRKYVLKEPSEAASVKYRNALMRAAKFGTDGSVTAADGLADLEPLLVSLCLFELDKDNFEKPVPLETVLAWPPRVVGPLFERAKALGGIGEKAGDAGPKAPPEPTVTTSP